MLLGNGVIMKKGELPIVWRFDECIVRGTQTVRFDKTFCNRFGNKYVISQQSKRIPLKVSRTKKEVTDNIQELLKYPLVEWDKPIDIGSSILDPNVEDYDDKLKSIIDYYMRNLRLNKVELFKLFIRSCTL